LRFVLALRSAHEAVSLKLGVTLQPGFARGARSRVEDAKRFPDSNVRTCDAVRSATEGSVSTPRQLRISVAAKAMDERDAV
jgi:hypothetical protein